MAHPTLNDILSAAKKLDGTGAGRELKVTVEPASFVSEGRGQYAQGDIVRMVRIGKARLSAYHVEALLREIGVWDYAVTNKAAQVAALFALRDE